MELTLYYSGRKYSKEYDFEEDVLAGIELDKIFQIDDGYFILKNKTLSKLDNDFQIENSITLEDYGEMIDMEIDAENVFLLFQKENETPKIFKINNDLEIISFFNVEDEYFRPNDIHLSEDEIGIGGYLVPNVPFNNTPFLYPSTSGYFKTIPKDGMVEEETIDLKIIDVKVENHEKIYNCGSPNSAGTYLLNLKNIKVRFVNNGTSTINNIDLFAQVEGVEDCVSSSFGSEYYLQKEELKLLHLAPGDTIDWRISPIEFLQNMDDSTFVNICIWHTSVNNQRDQNDDENYFCGEVKLEKLFEELPIVKSKDEEVLIYPNPLDDVMTVSLLQAPFEPTVIEFTDFLGRELGEKYYIAPRAKYKELDISDVPSGYYFVFISNDLISKGVLVYVN